MNKEKIMTLQEHFLELRRRVFFAVFFFVITLILSYFFSEKIYEFLLQPFADISNSTESRKLIYTNPSEAFLTYFKLSFFSALFFSAPIFFAEIYLFLAPALYKNEKKNILIIYCSSVFIFLFGAIFAYYFALPTALKFFASYENQSFANLENFSIHLETKISEYLNFVTNFLLAFGAAFQLPILLLFLIRVGCLSAEGLRQKRRYWIVIIFIAAAILTPPDVLSQISLAIPMILLFEIAVLIGQNLNNKN